MNRPHTSEGEIEKVDGVERHVFVIEGGSKIILKVFIDYNKNKIIFKIIVSKHKLNDNFKSNIIFVKFTKIT